MNKIYFILIICLVCGLIGCPYIFDDSLVGAWALKLAAMFTKALSLPSTAICRFTTLRITLRIILRTTVFPLRIPDIRL